jgi:hypothetical protein
MYRYQTIVYMLIFLSSFVLSDLQASVQDRLQQYLKSRVTFTPKGAAFFFKKTYNQTLYGEQFLPSSFIHVLDFLEYGHQSRLPRAYGITVFDIFLTRLAQAKWVNPYAYLQLIEALPELITDWCASDEERDKQALKQTLYQALLNNFKQLKEDPAQFLETTTDNLYSAIINPEEPSLKDFQYTITRFLESACNKLVFDPRDRDGLWNMVKNIADRLENLEQIHALPDSKTLNQLLWALLERFCYCISISGDLIDGKTYQTIQEELKNPTCTLFLIEEQERYMRSKRKRLARVLREAELKARARETT